MSRSSAFEVTLHLGVFEVLCKGDATPFDPGVVSGPPEHCYPPEGGEVEITEIFLRVQPGELKIIAGAPAKYLLEISDLIAELGGEDKIQELVEEELAVQAAIFDDYPERE